MKRVAGFELINLQKKYFDQNLKNLKNRSFVPYSVIKAIKQKPNLIYSFYNPKCTSHFYSFRGIRYARIWT